MEYKCHLYKNYVGFVTLEIFSLVLFVCICVCGVCICVLIYMHMYDALRVQKREEGVRPLKLELHVTPVF